MSSSSSLSMLEVSLPAVALLDVGHNTPPVRGNVVRDARSPGLYKRMADRGSSMFKSGLILEVGTGSSGNDSNSEVLSSVTPSWVPAFSGDQHVSETV
jgi:hypothetical protein